MSRSGRLLALLAAVLLLQTPAGFACEGPETMPPDCPMADMPGMDHSEMTDMAHAPRPESQTNDSRCGNCGGLADECCDVRSAPEPIQTPSADGSHGQSVVELAQQQSPAPEAPGAEPLRGAPGADPPDLSDLGCYTLYSAYLL